MYFKKLELFGFKSFAERTELVFEPGVTAVVGPNGCGKSNIADAIRWVLGEQSAKSLRSSSMEDVIFNGTATKEALNFTEVSFTLSNEERILPIDFDEVVITRRLFRSGESEYLINKVPVRLKDVTELLMGTGIGTEAYSLIEQGKIDLILSSKPEERRFVFEEASGITKYKSKKKEALRKLEQTEQNLLRVNDIILEVKRQINFIERQAKKAEAYKERFEELKNLEVNLATNEYNKFSNQKSALESELKLLKDSKSQIEVLYNELKNNIDSLSGDLEVLEKELGSLDRENLTTQNQLKLNLSRLTSNEDRIAEYTDNISLLENEVKSLENKISLLESEIKAANEELERVARDREERQKEIFENENKLLELDNSIKDNVGAIARGKVELFEFASKHSNLKNELVKLAANLQNVSARHRRLNVERENVLKEYSSLEPKVNSHLLELTSLKEKVQSQTDSFNQTQGKISNLEAHIRTLEDAVNKNNTRLASYESKLEFLLDLKRRHEGFSAGTRVLLEALQNGEVSRNGVLGVLSELIEPVKNFELTVELALGGNLEGVVVEEEQDAKRLIQFLKEKGAGVAKFFMLGIFNNSLPLLIGEDNEIRPISGFIKCDDRLKNLIGSLLGNCYLVKDIDTALRMCKDRNVRFITENKEIVELGLITTGYSAISEDTSILTRESRIKELSEFISQTKRENKDIADKKIVFEKEREDLISSLRAQEDVFKAESQKLLAEEKEYESLGNSIARLKEELSLVNLEIDEITDEEASFKEKERSINESFLQAEDQQKKLDSTITDLQRLIERNLKEKEGILLKLTQDRTLLSGISDKEANLNESLRKLNLNFAEQTQTARLKTQTACDYKDKSKSLKKEAQELEAVNEKLTEAINKYSEDLKSRFLKKDQMTAQIKDIKSSLYIKQGEFDAANKRSQDIELELTEFNLKCENIKNRINEIYKTELISGVQDEALVREDAIKQIERLKAKIESMGTVNMVAIEEHKELVERYNFLESQNQDLVNAKESLLKAITTINKTTKELFMETFQKIQVEFRNFVRLLFGGGDSELLLIDRDDVLESGIEIVAKPPGKKLQNIMLLSGGEKALTAIALLFAIFKVKPSPFCVLDEIDAPLDESNVGRFSKVLQDFVKMSQFIIITHNKKTITMADVMYGITMEESGVSKIVSVKFSESEPQEKETLKETV
jgi:chromosome segregation protein